MTSASPILLDESYTNALIVSGYNTGVLPSYAGGDSAYEQRFLGEWADPAKARTAFNFLLLHGQLTLTPWFDNFEIPTDVPIALAPSFGRKNPEMTCPVDPEEVERLDLLYPTMSLLRSWGNHAGEAQVRDAFEKAEFYSEVLWARFEASATPILARMTGDKEQPDLARKLQELGRRQEEWERIAKTVVPIYRAIESVYASITMSTNHRGPALWSCDQAYKRKIERERIETENVVVGLYLDGLPTVEVNSLNDALELLTHDAIAEFRSEVSTAVDNLRLGNWSEKSIDKRLVRASSALRAANLAGKAGGLITMASVPAIAVPPVSAGLAITGAVTLVGGWAAKRKHRWALLGTPAKP